MRVEVDVEGMLSRFLRDQPELQGAVDSRVYTDLPHERTYPLVLVQRTGGLPIRGFTLGEATCQVKVYGGTHKQAQDLTATILGLLEGLVGPQPEGSVSGVNATNVEYDPDPETPDKQGHARPRYVSEVTVYAHP
jgi:Protein of unknown function (DUF3168)